MLSLVTAPAREPFVWDDLLQTHLRLDDDDELRALSEVHIPAAREWCESFTERQLITATWNLHLDRFPLDDYIIIPKPPLQSVTHLKYYDTGGVQQTWGAANYIVDAPSGEFALHGRLALAPYVTWPTAQERVKAIEIQFKAGYGTDMRDIPAGLRAAMLLHIGRAFDLREDGPADTATARKTAWPYLAMRF